MLEISSFYILHICNKNHNHMRHSSWDTEFFVTFGHFWPVYLPNNLENQNFEKMKKESGDVITLHICTIKDNHMMYGSWYMECNRHDFLSLWTILCRFTPLTTQKSKILKKMKIMTGDIIILHKCTINDNHMMYGSWDMVCDRWTGKWVPHKRWLPHLKKKHKHST